MTAREYMFLGVMGAVSFVCAFALGTGLNAATGIPMVGGLVNGIVVGVLLTVGAKGVPKFGAPTLLWTLLSVFAIPTLTVGPPGLQKVVVGVATGFIWDLVVLAFRWRTAGYVLGAGIGSVAATLGVFAASLLLGLPAAEKLAKALVLVLPLNFVIGAISGYLGVLLFDRRVSRLKVMKDLLG